MDYKYSGNIKFSTIKSPKNTKYSIKNIIKLKYRTFISKLFWWKINKD